MKKRTNACDENTALTQGERRHPLAQDVADVRAHSPATGSIAKS
jgi:hypothetical protein